jgi:hypothetical protein
VVRCVCHFQSDTEGHWGNIPTIPRRAAVNDYSTWKRFHRYWHCLMFCSSNSSRMGCVHNEAEYVTYVNSAHEIYLILTEKSRNSHCFCHWMKGKLRHEHTVRAWVCSFTRWKWIAIFTSLPPGNNSLCPLDRRLGRTSSWFGLCGRKKISCFCLESSPDPPLPGSSLYKLHYHNPW